MCDVWGARLDGKQRPGPKRKPNRAARMYQGKCNWKKGNHGALPVPNESRPRLILAVIIVAVKVIVAIQYESDANYYRHHHRVGEGACSVPSPRLNGRLAMSGPVSLFTQRPPLSSSEEVLQFPCHLDLPLEPSFFHPPGPPSAGPSGTRIIFIPERWPA